MFQRQIKLPKLYSFFLFGARATGKSTLIRQRFPDAHIIDLLSAAEEDRFTRNPDLLERVVLTLPESQRYIVIDEIQKIPRLLDNVHRLIESTSKIFILTGSNARKLRHGGANLLAGRAFIKNISPLTSEELGEDFDLADILRWGSLPKIFDFDALEDKRFYLQAYALTYLKEEIWSEHLIRKLEPFRKFLEVAAQHNGRILNFSNIASDCHVDSKTIKTYFQILEDTLIGRFLEPFNTSVRKRIHKAPKFYFFDIGVTRALANILTLEPVPGTSYFGQVFEHFVIMEFFRQEDYLARDYQFSYLMTKDGVEIDLIVERPGRNLVLIEIKSTEIIKENSIAKLAAFQKDFPDAELWCLSLDKHVQKIGSIKAMPWHQGLLEI